MPMRFRPRPRGFSLIELSVATAIYSLGLGSVSLMLLLAVRGTTEARFDTTATLEAASLAELILLNSDAAGHYAAPLGAGTAGCVPGASCSPGEIAAWQLETWRARLAAELPGGQGLVCRDSTPDDGDADNAACDGGGGRVIKIFWNLPAAEAEPDGGSGRQVLRLPWP